MVNLLLPIPWWLLVLLAIAGIAMFISGNNRRQEKLRSAGLAVVLLTVGLLLINHFVQTDVEKVSTRSREVMRAVQDGNWPKLKSLMDPKVTLATVLGTLYKDRDDLVQAAQNAAEGYKLKAINVSSMEVKQDQAGITANIDVFTIQEETMDRPVPSSWQFDWEKTDDGWLLYRITCLKIGDQEAGSIKGLIRR